MQKDIGKILKFKKINSDAIVPKKSSKKAAGFDLYANLKKDIELNYGELTKIPCGIALQIPEGFAGFIFARSGLGINNGIFPANAVGVIDSDYRGEIIVGLCCVKKKSESYIIKNKDRIAQLVIIKINDFILEEIDELDNTERGENGFGSSGR